MDVKSNYNLETTLELHSVVIRKEDFDVLGSHQAEKELRDKRQAFMTQAFFISNWPEIVVESSKHNMLGKKSHLD